MRQAKNQRDSSARRPNPQENEIALRPGAWGQFEKAVDAAAKVGPIRSKKPAAKGRKIAGPVVNTKA